MVSRSFIEKLETAQGQFMVDSEHSFGDQFLNLGNTRRVTSFDLVVETETRNYKIEYPDYGSLGNI